MDENSLSFEVRRAAFKVQTTLGPGLPESVYELALAFERRQAGLWVETQGALPVVIAGSSWMGATDSICSLSAR